MAVRMGGETSVADCRNPNSESNWCRIRHHTASCLGPICCGKRTLQIRRRSLLERYGLQRPRRFHIRVLEEDLTIRLGEESSVRPGLTITVYVCLGDCISCEFIYEVVGCYYINSACIQNRSPNLSSSLAPAVGSKKGCCIVLITCEMIPDAGQRLELQDSN
jgi:hypothetical protein